MNTSNQHKLKALFILPNLQVGGAERVMVTLMNNLDRERFAPEFLTISNQGPLQAQIAQHIPFHSLNGKRVSRAMPSLYKKLKALQPDLVVSTMAHVNFTTLLLRPLFPKTKFIVREAALPSMIFQSRRSMAWAIKIAYRILYPTADLVISPSRPVQQEFSALKLPMKNHALLYNPLDSAKIRTAGIINAPSLNSDRTDTIHFIASGQFYWPKGFDRLIQSLKNLKIRHDWHLTILGDGRDRLKLESLIKENNLERHVSLPGFFSNPWPLYAEADCFLLSSRSEGMPNVALEALACGTPVIGHQEAGGIIDIAALADSPSVKISQDMESFISNMRDVSPQKKYTMAPSLLPEDFNLRNVIFKFSEMLESAHKKSTRQDNGKS